jgi:Na+/H+ antiporter NhaD/arsenite permease-like protein
MNRTLIKTTFFLFILWISIPLLIENSWAIPNQLSDYSHSINHSINESANSLTTLENHDEHHENEIGKELPLWTVIPFLGILLSIAIFPLVAPNFWHHHFPKVSAFWALIFAFPFIYVYHGVAIHEILHIYLVDYFPFIILLWALFTIAGGIVIRGNLQGKPIVNTILLLIGTFLASWVGTTGAAMIMIRPVLRANATRKKKVHIICFFIFLVANIGGSLTPLGDPPLFLGFLHGVPFFWTFNIFPHMLLVSVILLITFFFLDTFYYRQEKHKTDFLKNEEKETIRVEGWHNFFFLAGVVGSVLMSGIIKLGEFNIFGILIPKQNLLRDFLMILMGILSLRTTKEYLRKANEFTWFPIKEVGYLFAGIFMTIIPALAILQAGSEGALAFLFNMVNEPYHYFWITGSVSSFLDNAPTYLSFFYSALGKLQIPEPMVREALGYVSGAKNNPEFILYLKAISVGAVFMGANTYIGNAPNFMVKSIAEEAGIAMPSFLGYILKYSIPILIPLFIFVTLIFF